MTSPIPSGTVTFLFTDIEGSTQLWEEHPDAMKRALAKHDALLRQVFETHTGYVFKTMGDAFCVAFASPSDAVNAALEAQRALQKEAWGETPLQARLALHTSEAEERDGDYFGPPLNRVTRLMSAGHGGQILLSVATQELVRDQLPKQVTLSDLGEHRLKDLFRPEHIYQLDAPGLPADFPPLRSLNLKLTNLPAQSTPFIGRERQVAAGLGLLRDPEVRLVTLAGPGGTGKTRLAMQIAADLLDDYEQGVWFVDLAPITNPSLVCGEIATVLSVKEVGAESLETTVIRFLHDRSVLLVLDNYEQVISAAPLVSQLLAGAPRLKVLVTSREVLQVYGEHSYHVPPLSLPDLHRKETVAVISQYEAVSLFIQRAQAAKPTFEINNDNAPAVAEICVRLDGLPLAIELAAARIALFSPHQLLQRLADRLKTVSGGLRDLPARQRTLRGTIDWSYDLLAPDEKILFARLSVFRGGRTLEAAEAVCGAGLGSEVADGLESLIHKSLLRPVSGATNEPRYVMLETIHEYAREKLTASGEEQTIRARHADYFTQLGERANPEIWREGTGRWSHILGDEQDNILSALEWAFGGAAIEIGARLVAAIGLFWFNEGRYSLSKIWVTRALESQDALTPDLRAQLFIVAGTASWAAYEFERAREQNLQALILYREIGNTALMGRSYTQLAASAMGFPELYEQAKIWVNESLTIARQNGDLNMQGWTLNVLGEVARSVGDYATAKKAYEDCLPLTRQVGNRRREMIILGNFGHVYSHEGDYQRALGFGRQAMQKAYELNSGLMTAEALHIIARATGLSGNPEKAARLYGASEAQYEKLGARLQAGDLADYQQGLTAVRALVEPTRFEVLWAEGRMLETEQAIEYALKETPV